MVSPRNVPLATKVSEPELDALLRYTADQETAGDRRASKSRLAADLIHEGLVARGYLTDAPASCDHPKAQRQVHDWGTTCGVCGVRVTT